MYLFIYLYTCFGDVGCLSESMATLGTSTTHTCAHHCIPGMIVLKYEWKVHTSRSCCFGLLFMYIEETINNCLRTCANTISNHKVHACWLAMASTNGFNQFQKHVNAVLKSPKRRFDHSLYTYLILYSFYLRYSSNQQIGYSHDEV